MLKKIFISLLALVLTACASKTNIETKEYIDPVMDIFLFDEISKDEQTKIKKANGNKEYKNFQFEMLGIGTYDEDLIDINGNHINLNDYDKLILEVVSCGCEHCKEMICKYNDDLLESGVKIIQYFNVGNNDDIVALYKDINADIPNDITVISENEDFGKYLRNVLKLEFYPSLISYLNGVVSFNEYGDIKEDELKAFVDMSFNDILSNRINIEELCKKNRSIDDVKVSLSVDNLNKIKALDNDNNTLDYTLKLIGTKLDFENISGKNTFVYVNEITSYEGYENKDLVLIYTYLSNVQEEYKVDFINKLIDSNDKVEYIVVLIEGIDSSSNVYNSMSTKFHAPAVSVLASIPEDFFKIGIRNYPTAIFVEKGTFTGAYSNIENAESFNSAIDIFIGDKCIALKTNN